MAPPVHGPVDDVDRRPPPHLVGYGTLVAVLLVVLLVSGIVAFGWWFSSALGCPVGDAGAAGPARAVKDLETAVAPLPGVVAIKADFSPGPCHWYDRLEVDVTVSAAAHPEQVAAAAALVAAGLDGAEIASRGERQ
jgi:hypothetical protein